MSEPMAQRLDGIVESAKERLLGIAEAIDKAVGDMPYGGRKLNPDEQMERWLVGRNDPAFWQGLIAERQGRYGLTPDLLPRDVVDLDKEMQRRWENRDQVIEVVPELM